MSDVGNPSSDEPAASTSASAPSTHQQQPDANTDDKFVLTLLMDSQQWVNPESSDDPTKHQRHVVKHLKTKKGVDTQLVTPSLPAGNYLWTMRRTSEQENSVLDEQACPVLDVIVLRVEYSHLISKAWKKSKRYHPLSTLELWHRKMQFSSLTRKILIVQGGPSEAEVASNNKKATQVQDLLAEYPDDFELYELAQAKDTVKLLKQLHQEIYESLQTQTNHLGTYLQSRPTLAQLRLQVETSLHSPKFHLELSLRRHVFAKNQKDHNSDRSATPDYVTILKGIWEKVLDTYHQSEPALEEAVATNAAEQVVKLGLLLSSSSSSTILSELLSNPEEARAIAKDFVESHKLQRWRAASLESEASAMRNKQEEPIEQPVAAAANPEEQGDSKEPDQPQEGGQTGMSMEDAEGAQQPEATAPMEKEVEIIDTVAAPAPAPNLSQPQQEEDDIEFQQLVNAIWLLNLRSDEAARHAKEGLCQHFSNMQGVLQALSSGGESRRQAMIVVKAVFAAYGISLAPPSAPTSAASSRRGSVSDGLEAQPPATAPGPQKQQQPEQQQEAVTVDALNVGLHKVHQRVHQQHVDQTTAIQNHFQELYKMMEQALQFNREALKTQQTQHKQHISTLQRQHKTSHDQVMQSLLELRSIIQGGQEIGQKDLHTCTHALIKGIEKAYATMSAEYQRYHLNNVQKQQQESKVIQQQNAQALLKAQEQRRQLAQNLEQRHSHSAQQVAPLPSHHPLEAAPTLPHYNSVHGAAGVQLAHQLAQQQAYHRQQAQQQQLYANHAQVIHRQQLAQHHHQAQQAHQAHQAPAAILPPPEFEPPSAPPPSNPILSSAMLQSNDDEDDEVQIVDPPSAAVGEKRARPEEGKEEESASTPVNNHKRAKEGDKDHGGDDLDLSDTDDEG